MQYADGPAPATFAELEPSKFPVDNTYASEINYALDLVLPGTLLDRVSLKYNSESSDSLDTSLLGLEHPFDTE